MVDTISSGDKAKLRGAWRPSNVRLDVFPLQPFATGTVGSLSGLTYPFADIPVTSPSAEWANARRGEYVQITDSGSWVMDTVWRKNSDGTTYLRALGIDRGDSGKAVQQAAALAAGQSIVSYTVRVPKSFPSRLAGDPAVYYKRWDLPFSTFDPSPQANIGQHRAADIGSGTTVTLSEELDTTTSTSWGGGTFTVEWVKPSTASYVGGTNANSNPAQIAYAPGAYVLPCIVTDSSRAGSERSYRYRFISGDDGGGNSYSPFSDDYGLVGVAITHTREGSIMTFEVEGDASAALYTGAPVLFTYTDEYSTDGGVTWSTLTEGVNVNNVFGYLYSYETIETSVTGIYRTRFTVLSPLLYADSLPFFGQDIFENDTPTEWWHVPSTHTFAAFMVAYVNDLHSRWASETHDYTYNANALLYYKVRWVLDSDSMGGAMRVAASPFAGNFGCLPDGTFHLEMNPQYMQTADRDAVDTVLTITDADILAENDPAIKYTLNEVMTQRGIQVGAFIYTDTDNVKAKMYEKGGLGAPMQGVGRPTARDFIALDATEAQYKVGHMFQELNAPCQSVSFDMPGGYNIFRPAQMKWYALDLAAYDPMSSGIWSNRILPQTITEKWEAKKSGWDRTINFTGQPEFYGQPATRKTIQEYRGGGITPSNTWCLTFDFVNDGNGGWVQDSGNPSGYAYGVYTAGVGWEDSDQTTVHPGQRGIYISFTFAASTTITSVSVLFNGTLGVVTDTSLAAFAIQNKATYASLLSVAYTAMTWGSNLTRTWTGEVATTGITAFIRPNFDQVGPITYSGDALIKQIVICGTGPNRILA